MSDLEPYVAYHGWCKLKNAIDSHATGFKIQLRLNEENDYKLFKDVTKRRKGKAGHLYQMQWRVDGDGNKSFTSMDVWFLGWTVSHSNGAVVAFQIEDHSKWHFFREMLAIDAHDENPASLEILLFELDQEGKPINQKQRARLEMLHRKRKFPKGGVQSKRAARLGQNPDFLMYLATEMGKHAPTGGPLSANDVAVYIYECASIDSRAQLDHDEEALARFETNVMSPFNRWRGQQ